MARFLNLPTSQMTKLQVMVGNSSILDCDTSSSQVPIFVQGHTFTLYLFHLPLSGAEIVLGVQWLKLLSSVTIDYATLTMSFLYLGQPITLHADMLMSPSSSLDQQLKCFAQTQSIVALFHLAQIPTQDHTSSSPQHPLDQPTPPVITSIIN